MLNRRSLLLMMCCAAMTALGFFLGYVLLHHQHGRVILHVMFSFLFPFAHFLFGEFFVFTCENAGLKSKR